MSPHHRSAAVAQASEDISHALTVLQREHGLTDVEMLMAVDGWQRLRLLDMLRAERADPGKGADEE
jgi:hypothetical protein